MNKPQSKVRIAEQLMSRPEGATMEEILAATGGFQYNAKPLLEARGYTVRTEREGRRLRYFATPPGSPVYEATVTSKGQVTIPKQVRERLRLHPGAKVRFIVREDGTVEFAPKRYRLSDLFGILGKPPRPMKLEEIDDAIADAVVEKYRRSISESRE